jgi:hypothetical protein
MTTRTTSLALAAGFVLAAAAPLAVPAPASAHQSGGHAAASGGAAAVSSAAAWRQEGSYRTLDSCIGVGKKGYAAGRWKEWECRTGKGTHPHALWVR